MILFPPHQKIFLVTQSRSFPSLRIVSSILTTLNRAFSDQVTYLSLPVSLSMFQDHDLAVPQVWQNITRSKLAPWPPLPPLLKPSTPLPFPSTVSGTACKHKNKGPFLSDHVSDFSWCFSPNPGGNISFLNLTTLSSFLLLYPFKNIYQTAARNKITGHTRTHTCVCTHTQTHTPTTSAYTTTFSIQTPVMSSELC